MGWLWGSSDASSSPEDPTSKLDASLRQYLKDSSSLKSPTPLPSSSIPVESEVPPKTNEPPQPQELDAPNSQAKVPPESLYQDGRYAHIWKNYKPLQVIEAKGKSDQEKLTDIMYEFNDKKGHLKKMAVESCALENLELSQCWESGPWKSRMTGCHAENKTWIRCFETQAKFLRALGFLQIAGTSQEAEDRVQMQADVLYRRMLKQEEEIKKAEQAGETPPEFTSILSKEMVVAALRDTQTPPETRLGDNTDKAPILQKNEQTSTQESKSLEDPWSMVSESRRKELEKLLEGKTGAELALEKASIEGEIIATHRVGKELSEAWIEERNNRLQRRAEGLETFGDRVRRWWGW